jgi:transmembrane sensor
MLSDPVCTLKDRQAFVAWLKRSNLNVEEFLRISSLTRRLHDSTLWPHTRIEDLIAAAQSAASNITHLSGAESIEPLRRSRAPRGRLMWVACAVLLPVILALLALAGSAPWQRGGPVYATVQGEQRSITLDDGSIVQLNTQSQLRVRFTKRERAVELDDGEAVFKVAANPTRPFRVMTDSTEVVAVGTEFNVYKQAGTTTITVIEGHVRVAQTPGGRAAGATADSRRIFELAPGEQAVLGANDSNALVQQVDPNKVIGWTERRLYFDNTPLADVVREFSRYSPRVIHIANAPLAQRRISGTFDSGDPAALVDFLTRFTDTPVVSTQDGWTLGQVAAD